MVPKVTVRGAEHLPQTVSKENLRLAAIKLGSYYGIKKVTLVIKDIIDNEDEPSFGEADLEGKTKIAINFYAPAIRRWVHAKKGRTLRKIYAKTLAHEMAHIRQWTRGAYDELPEDLAEKEANAMESVYFKIALECLRS
jgi:hypothetical protein